MPIAVSRFAFVTERDMKVNLIFVLIDIVVFLAYPVLFVINKVRRLLEHRR